jgi:hypothetical protein
LYKKYQKHVNIGICSTNFDFFLISIICEKMVKDDKEEWNERKKIKNEKERELYF